MLKNTTIKVLNMLMDNKEIFTSLNVTYLVKNYLQSSDCKEICLVNHQNIAKEVRNNFIDGAMDKKEYSCLLEEHNVEMNGKLYTTSIFYPKGEVLTLPFKITTLLKKSNKVKFDNCNCSITTNKLDKESCCKAIGKIKDIKSKPKNIIDNGFVYSRADGRLEIPQLILKKFGWLNELELHFSKRSGISFFISKEDSVKDFSCVNFVNRVRIPKTVFTHMGLPTSITQYKIFYDKDMDVFIISR